jgi:hypothetical protein
MTELYLPMSVIEDMQVYRCRINSDTDVERISLQINRGERFFIG